MDRGGQFLGLIRLWAHHMCIGPPEMRITFRPISIALIGLYMHLIRMRIQ